MLTKFTKETCDVWTRMKTCGKPIVMYGMGNGADKILSVMEKEGIAVSDFFASDGFVRGHSFHGKTVLSYADISEKYDDMLIVLAFGSDLDDVMARFFAISERYETVAPEVPLSGDILFTHDFACAHIAEFERAYALLADHASRRLFCDLFSFKLTGKLCYLKNNATPERELLTAFLQGREVRTYLDLGAYSGDTVRALLDACDTVKEVYAFEPDARSYKKLAAYAESETRAAVTAYPYAAWDKNETLIFSDAGNRNSALMGMGGTHIGKEKAVNASAPDTVLCGKAIDYIKLDVEGAEREALCGCKTLIAKYHPILAVCAYHRAEDLFALPLQIHALDPTYRIYLRRPPYVPAWDTRFYCV